MNTWDDLSKPVFDKLGYGTREQQRDMGNAVIKAIETKGSVIVEAPTGTGKSLALLIPIIDRVKNTEERAVISTATKTLQDQYLNDLERLCDGSFTYHSLKGKDNYLCRYRLLKNKDNKYLEGIVRNLLDIYDSLETGERWEVEDKLGYRLDDRDWKLVASESEDCSGNKCKSSDCYAALSLEKARASSIVVTNNAILRVDADALASGLTFLGPVAIVAVDEAHELESSLISGWTLSLTEWEISDLLKKANKALSEIGEAHIGYEVEDWLYYAKNLFLTLNNNDLFKQSALKVTYMTPESNQKDIDALLLFEGATETLKENFPEEAENSIKKISEEAETGMYRKRVLSKGTTAIYKLLSFVYKVTSACESDTGTFMFDKTPHVAIQSCYKNKKGEIKTKFDCIPLDISESAKVVWKDRTVILTSATMRDISTQDYSYICSALGITPDSILTLTNVFDTAKNQLLYMTSATEGYPTISGSQFSLEEMEKAIYASHGRALVLFTSKYELEQAHEYIKNNPLPYKTMFQLGNTDKNQLAIEFRRNTDSVLFATKSFFQGVDFKGETLSQVILVKFPLLQYNDLCQAQETWWKGRGFKQWYNSKSMEVFQQAVGRVLRTETDRGVITMLDQRVLNSRSRIHSLTGKLVESLGMSVTQDIQDIGRFLECRS